MTGMIDSGIFWLFCRYNLKIRGSSRVSRPHSSAFKVQPNLFSFLEILRLRNLVWDFLGVQSWSRDFLGFAGSPKEFFGF